MFARDRSANHTTGPEMILLDTNVLAELTKPAAPERVADWLADNEQRLALSAVTLAELRFGIARLREVRSPVTLNRRNQPPDQQSPTFR